MPVLRRMTVILGDLVATGNWKTLENETIISPSSSLMRRLTFQINKAHVFVCFGRLV